MGSKALEARRPCGKGESPRTHGCRHLAHIRSDLTKHDAGRSSGSRIVLLAASHCRFGKITTCKKEGLMVEFTARPGTVTPAMIESLGRSPTLRTHRDMLEIRFWVSQPGEINARVMKEVLTDCLRAEEA